MTSGSYETRGRRSFLAERVEVRVRPERRRNWSVEDKLRIVQEALERGTVAKAVADRHGISTGLVFTWRKRMLATAMAGFVPVDVVPEAPGTIEIGLPSGTTVRVGGHIDPGLLRAVLAELGGR